MSIKQYSYATDGNKNLSEHFKVKEFASVNGSKVYADIIKIDTELINKLEKLYSVLGCSSITINSGYRSPQHDIAVGGSGYGKHVEGLAADIVCKVKGEIVNSKIVCCIASELGFGGVANISKNYRAVHVDTRSGSKYYGDEIRGYNSIWKYNKNWTDFYKYFNLTKEEVDKYKMNKSELKWQYKYDEKIQQLQKILTLRGKKITIDGIAGNKTYEAVKSYTLDLGDGGLLTKWTQERLNQLGYECKITSIVLTDTMNAINKFQKDNGLKEGYLGGTDWYYLLYPVK